MVKFRARADGGAWQEFDETLPFNITTIDSVAVTDAQSIDVEPLGDTANAPAVNEWASVTGTTGSPTVNNYMHDGHEYDEYLFLGNGSITTTAGRVWVSWVGGAGSGGNVDAGSSGGGSGGDVLNDDDVTLTATTHDIIVGAGASNGSGSDTVAFGVTARRGGRGGSNTGTYSAPIDGGGAPQRNSGDPTAGAAHPTSGKGGDALRLGTNSGQKRSGGGRGAGGSGVDAASSGTAAGGPGVEVLINGSLIECGRGGSGKNNDTTANGADGVTYGDGGDGATSTSVGNNSSGGAGIQGCVVVRVRK